MTPLAFTPLAWNALRIGAVAAMAIYAARQRSSEPKHAQREQVLDDLPDGFSAHSHRAEAERGLHATGRFRRVFRVGPQGAGVEIEASGLGRFRMRRAG